MLIRWQRSEIHKAHTGLVKLTSALRTHKLCHRCDCPRVEHAVNYTSEDCEIRRRLYGHDVEPGWHTVTVPVPGNRCSFGYELADGRVLYETRVKAILCDGESTTPDEPIVSLGTIEASWLESFYEGMTEKEVVQARVQDWESNALTQRYWFWRSVAEKFDAMAEEKRITAAQRRKLEGSISEVVPKPTSREANAVEHREKQAKLRLAI